MARRAPNAKRFPFALRLARNQDGATAVEFAIVALPFFGLIAGIIELGMLFMGSIALDNAMQVATRKIRTGEIQSPKNPDPAAQATAAEAARGAFKSEICNNMGFFKDDCEAKLTIDVRTAVEFDDLSVPNPIQNGAFDPGALQFNTGGRETIVIVTAYYRWTMFFPMMNQALQRLPGETLMTSAITFQTEPY